MGRLETLFQGYLGNRLSEAEYAELWQLLEQESNLQRLSPELQKLWEAAPAYRLPASDWDKKIKTLQAERNPKSKRVPIWRYAAAAILLLMAGGIYFNLREKPEAVVVTQPSTFENDIVPGTNGAILTFSSGKTIVLDTAHNGQVTDGIVKSDGNITANGMTVEYATLTTPRAKQEQLTLDDGTKVWLNAASSIRFLTAFNGGKRIVEITGEAYFEVKKKLSKPFIVKVGESEIKVLGTHFNVMAYDNESTILTTLLEGSVQFSMGKNNILLKPGQQSSLDRVGHISVVDDADTEVATAWKNGQQMFRKSDIATIMRQVERWYNVDVVYKTSVPANVTFSGDVPRDVNLLELLKAFEQPYLHFIIDRTTRKLTVTE